MVITDATFQVRVWSKADAAENALAMFDTDATFHLPMSVLNAVAVLSKLAMLATDAVFQPETSRLKANAPLNMPAMVDTDATFHSPMPALNVA